MTFVTEARNLLGRARGYGGCYRCGGTWDYTPHHTTWFRGGISGCFPLCEDCWSCLTPEERLPYYAKLVGMWLTGAPSEYIDQHLSDWQEIRRAVLEGK